MAAIFRAIFGCCCGEPEKEARGAREPLLAEYETRNGPDDAHVASLASANGLDGEDEERTLVLNQKVADIVQNGTGRMLSPAITRMNGAYSPILGVASTSQANIVNGPRTSHTQRSQPESRHSSQSSRQSSYKHHQPSLVPHLEGPPSEDAGSTFDALNTSYSLASYGGNRTRQEHANYGTMVLGGLGASATQRRFQVHRGRPPSRKKNDEYEPVSDPAGQKIQPNGLLPSAGHAHELEQPPAPETSPTPAEDANSLSTSSPLRINRASNERSSAERGPDIDEKRKVHFELPPGDLILHYD